MIDAFTMYPPDDSSPRRAHFYGLSGSATTGGVLAALAGHLDGWPWDGHILQPPGA